MNNNNNNNNNNVVLCHYLLKRRIEFGVVRIFRDPRTASGRVPFASGRLGFVRGRARRQRRTAVHQNVDDIQGIFRVDVVHYFLERLDATAFFVFLD